MPLVSQRQTLRQGRDPADAKLPDTTSCVESGRWLIAVTESTWPELAESGAPLVTQLPLLRS